MVLTYLLISSRTPLTIQPPASISKRQKLICVPPKHASDEWFCRPRSRHNAKPWPAQPSSSADSKQSNGQTHRPSNSSSGLVRHSSPVVEPDNMFVNMCPYPLKGMALCTVNLLVAGGQRPVYQASKPQVNHKETEKEPTRPQTRTTGTDHQTNQNIWGIFPSPQYTSHSQQNE